MGGGNYSGIYSNVQFRVTVQGGFTNPIELDAISTPPGVYVSFNTNLFTNSQTITMMVAVTNVAKGVYPLTIQASNSITSVTYATNVERMIFGTLWINPNPAVVTWNNAANWSAGIPANGDDVMFQDGTDTNYLDYSVALASLTYLRNSNAFIQNTVLAPGTTLSVIGTNGFGASVQSINGNQKTTTIYIQGAGSSLVVSNQSADFNVTAVNTGGSGTTLIMTNLDNFTAIVSRFGLGDVGLAEDGGIAANLTTVSLARTNVINASFFTDYSVTNAIPFAVSLWRNGDDYNNGSANTANLGLSNSIVADSFAMGQARAGSGSSTLRFAPVFTNTAVTLLPRPYLYVRGTNGGRMTLFAIGIDSGANSTGGNAKGVAFFNNGTVDIMAKDMWLGRTRYTNTTAGAAAGTLTLDGGIVDVNTLRLGYQAYTNDSQGIGTLNVGGTAVVSVNNSLDLGFVIGYASSVHSATAGTISMTGGRILANTITVGLTNDNGVCTISTTAGELVVSNTIASSVRRLNTLSMNGGTLTLLLDGAKTDPYVWVNTLTVPSAGGNVLKIASVKNFTYPTNVPLISFVTGSATFSNIVMPSGLHGNLIPNVGNPLQYDLQILATTPKNIVWRGFVDSTWSTATSKTNWLDLSTGLATNFDQGDFVSFDDKAGVPTTINVVDSSMVPSAVSISNTVNHYIFNGTGSFLGSAAVTKTGTNALDINISMPLPVVINQGILNGISSATVGSLSIAAGASANYAGTINNGLSSVGTATVSGNSSGGIAVLTGGLVTQIGSFKGQFSVAANSTLINQGSLSGIGSSTTATNSLFVNSGNLEGGGLTIGGTYQDSGAGQLKFSNAMVINGNGVFMVGNADGSSQLTVNNYSISTYPQAGRVLFSNGSTNYFGVNTDNSNPEANANELLMISVDFGNNNTLNGGGGVIVLTNKGVAPFAAGQSFKLFGANTGTPDDPFYEAGTNTAPLIRPGAPGPGLAWDTRTLRTNGVIKVISVGTSLPVYGFSPVITNNLILFTGITTNGSVVSTNYSTNKAMITTLTWPATNVGWRLQQQIDGLTNGIQGADSNWTYIYPSWWTNTMTVTNTFASNQAIFFRLAYP